MDKEVQLLLGRIIERLPDVLSEDPALAWPSDPDAMEQLLSIDSDSEFVDRCYRAILGRPPDGPGRRSQLTRLAGGERPEVLRSMLGSEEAIEHRLASAGRHVTWDLPYALEAAALAEGLPLNLTYLAYVVAAYGAILGREPDPPGFVSHYRRLLQGKSRREIVDNLLGSPEAQTVGTSQTCTPELLQRLAEFGLTVAMLVLAARKLDALAVTTQRSVTILERLAWRLDELEARQAETMALLRERAGESPTEGPSGA